MQTTYSQTHAIGYEGDPANSDRRRVRPMRNNSGSVLPFGRVVVWDSSSTDDRGVKLPAAAADKILGVNLKDRAREDGSGVADDGMVNCLAQGAVLVAVEKAVTPASAVYVRFACGVEGDNADAGKVRPDADTVPAYEAETAVTLGQRRLSDTTKIYEVITAGTTAADAAPTGTGSDITDGTAHWKYVGTSAAEGVSVVALANARFLTSADAGGLAVLELSLP